jgi:glycogen operon protein
MADRKDPPPSGMADTPSRLPVTHPGLPLPFGVRLDAEGANFALFSRHATLVTLLLFRSAEETEPCCTIPLHPYRHRTGDVWHVWVSGVRSGYAYAYRVSGPWAPSQGHWYNPHKLLIDPLAPLMSGVDDWDFAAARAWQGDAAGERCMDVADNLATAGRGLVVNAPIDWEGDQPLRLPWSQTILYETHVRGFTVHASSGVACPGSYPGLSEKIPYLQALGVTAVELLPVQEFNEHGLDRRNPEGEQLRDYWGYNPVGFIAPKANYAVDREGGGPLLEFKRMVKALHRAGIEVFLDVVFNHTAEGNAAGPLLHLRGLDNPIYYLLDREYGHYRDDTGCGNTLNCNHPVVRDLILEALRHWVLEMHVDGFRFDLAAVLGRDEAGNVAPNAPLLERLAEDPILRETKLIAEAWDAGGAYELGAFGGGRWSEWNGRYRDEVRRFWRGEPGMAGALASRLCGSADIFRGAGKAPCNSINFVTSHDGFTLNDLVSYASRHNRANGEDNRDGPADDFSRSFGCEGATGDVGTEAMRRRQIRNLIATLMLSRGVPMLLGGDEFRRTQQGNNNAYCQDNEVSWYDWSLLEQHADIHAFTRDMIAFRKRHPLLCDESFYSEADVTWFDAAGNTPDWSAPSRHLGCCLHPAAHLPDRLCLLFNAADSTLEFRLPANLPGRWQVAVDTSQETLAEPVPLPGRHVPLGSLSLMVLCCTD